MQKRLLVNRASMVQPEHILVVKRDVLLVQISMQQIFALQGIHTGDYEQVVNAIVCNQQFLPRPSVECDAQYKQIVPYLVLMHDNCIFVVQRRADASEQRLAGCMSIGIGGHIRESDVIGGDPFLWAQRELHEEIAGVQVAGHKFVGFINDDSSEVGSVHFGIAYVVQLADSAITINSELKHGQWLTVCTMPAVDRFEPWSRLVLSVLGY